MSIPASQLVRVTPSVVSGGGAQLAANGLFLTGNNDAPLHVAMQFPDAASVGAWFGLTSDEYKAAVVYFNGYDNSFTKPARLYVYRFDPAVAQGAQLFGSKLGMTLAQLQAVTGSISITVDGVVKTWAAIDFSTATSFSQAATQLETGLGVAATTAITYNSTLGAFVLQNTTTGITSTLTYATGAGATALKLTQETGAILAGTGSAAETVAQIMERAIQQVTNFVSIVIIGTTDASATAVDMAAWSNSYNSRYMYVMHTTDAAATVANDTTSPLALIKQAEYGGVCGVYGAADKAYFIAGFAASLDFNRANGRATLAYRSQEGLTFDVTDGVVAQNLIANGYNFYGQYSTASDTFVFMQPGQITGRFRWVDTYLDQVKLNADLQQAYVSFFSQIGFVPDNATGAAMLEQVALDPINAMISYGGIVPGTALSNAQATVVNTQAGLRISGTLTNVGYYIQIKPNTAANRVERNKLPINLWWTDGGAVQSLDIASIAVQ